MDDDALGPQRRTHHSFWLNSETADMVRNLFCWAPVELAVLKPERQQHPHLLDTIFCGQEGRKSESHSTFTVLEMETWSLLNQCPK